MLPFPMFRLCPSLLRPTHTPSYALTTPQSDSSWFFNIPTFKPSNLQTSPSVTPLRAILDAASSISPVFAALTKNTRGGGYPSSSANSVPSVLKLTRHQSPTDPVDPRRGPTDTIPLIIRSSAKRARNSCRMRSFKTQDLKPFRICSCEKTGEGEGPLFKRNCLSVPSLSAACCQLSASRFPLYPVTVLLPLANSLDDGDVAIQGQICEPLDSATWLWPLHFERIQFCARANSQDNARIVRAQKAASTNLHAAALEVAGPKREARSNGIWV